MTDSMAKVVNSIDGCMDAMALDKNSLASDMSNYVATTSCVIPLLSKIVNDFIQNLIWNLGVASAQSKQLYFSSKHVLANFKLWCQFQEVNVPVRIQYILKECRIDTFVWPSLHPVCSVVTTWGTYVFL